MTRLVRLPALFLLAFAAVGCAPMTVSSHVERGLDLTRYRTFEWGSADALPTGDPRLDNNRFFIERVRDSVDRELAARF